MIKSKDLYSINTYCVVVKMLYKVIDLLKEYVSRFNISDDSKSSQSVESDLENTVTAEALRNALTDTPKGEYHAPKLQGLIKDNHGSDMGIHFHPVDKRRKHYDWRITIGEEHGEVVVYVEPHGAGRTVKIGESALHRYLRKDPSAIQMLRRHWERTAAQEFGKPSKDAQSVRALYEN